MTDPAELAGLIDAWLPGRRWYATKHLEPRIESVVVRSGSRTAVPGPGSRTAVPASGSPTPASASASESRAHRPDFLDVIVTDRPADDRIVYQVPLVRRTTAPDGVPSAAVLGRDREGRWLIDATFVTDYLRWILPAGLAIRSARVLEGEQSNTSVICSTSSDLGQVIVKLFRVLDEGSNPEVELQEALSRAGNPHVPRFLGSGWGSWHRGGRVEYGHLWVASEFIDDAEDAWRMASAAVARGEDIDAEGLGRAVAEVHRSLAREFPTGEANGEARSGVVGTWNERARLAVAAVPELEEYRERIEQAFSAARNVTWSPLQRIHGDLHLGQVMLAPRGWILLDFEGEPLRPLAERRRADQTLRDVAGMLRSFDYVAGTDPGPTELAWVDRQREAFLDGYAAVADDPRAHGALLRALELDKALYEARYEAGNRPEWLGIPLRGIARLTYSEPS